MPTTFSPSAITGSTPQSFLHIRIAASARLVSRLQICTSFGHYIFYFHGSCLVVRTLKADPWPISSANLANNCAIFVSSRLQRAARRASLCEKLANFIVACLRKIFVPLADRIELFPGTMTACNLVGCALDVVIRGCRDDGRRDHDAARHSTVGAPQSPRAWLSQSRCRRRRELRFCLRPPETAGRHDKLFPSVVQFGVFSRAYGINYFVGNPQRIHNVSIEYAHTAGGDCAHCQFRMIGANQACGQRTHRVVQCNFFATSAATGTPPRGSARTSTSRRLRVSR